MTATTTFTLEHMMRWYGPADPVPLRHIAQAGCSGVVSALHDVPVGATWETEEIQAYQDRILAEDLTWSVVESLPVHEDIKTRSGDFENYIRNYQQSLRNLGACGIKVVTYNFMPALDWVRTDVAFQLPTGAETLAFNMTDFTVADLFLLQRPGASDIFSEHELEEYRAYYSAMDVPRREHLLRSILSGLPGSKESFTVEQVLGLIAGYQGIGSRELKQNLYNFLEAVVPVAAEAGIQLAVHPDDPPFSLLGLPRVVSTAQDIEDMMTAVPDPANGLCFCTGSLGARPDNDLLQILRKWGSRVYFFHLRNTRRDRYGNFVEADHLDGDSDMARIMYEIVYLMQRERRSIPVRPDHGFKILDDLGKQTYPGYSMIGRLKGLAELRGLERGISAVLSQNAKSPK